MAARSMRYFRASSGTGRRRRSICRRRMPGWNCSEPNPGPVMKISTFRSQILHIPEDEPLAAPEAKAEGARPIVILTLSTDNGIEGIGVTFYGGALTATLK